MYQSIEITDLNPAAAMQIMTIPSSWHVEIAGTEIRIPENRFDEVLNLLNRAD